MTSPRIFVTVGTQLAFDRLVKAVLDWAQMPGSDYAQIDIQCGQTDLETVNLPRVNLNAYTSPEEFDVLFQKADLVIAHAGMGTIIKALDMAKPLVILPRLYVCGEHRNDHQLGTCREMARLPNVFDCEDEDALPSRIFDALAYRYAPGQALHFSGNRDQLIDFVKNFVNKEVQG